MSKVEKAAVIGGAFAIVAAIVGGLFLIYSAKAGATPSVSTNNVSSNSTLNQARPYVSDHRRDRELLIRPYKVESLTACRNLAKAT